MVMVSQPGRPHANFFFVLLQTETFSSILSLVLTADSLSVLSQLFMSIPESLSKSSPLFTSTRQKLCYMPETAPDQITTTIVAAAATTTTPAPAFNTPGTLFLNQWCTPPLRLQVSDYSTSPYVQ
jgi:hypothetical protein